MGILWPDPHHSSRVARIIESRIAIGVRWSIVVLAVSFIRSLESFLARYGFPDPYRFLACLALPLAVSWLFYLLKPNWNYSVIMARFVGASDVKIDKGLGYAHGRWKENYYIHNRPVMLSKTAFTTFALGLMTAIFPYGIGFLILTSASEVGKVVHRLDYIPNAVIYFWGTGVVVLFLWGLFRRAGGYLLSKLLLRQHPDLRKQQLTVVWEIRASS